MLADGVYGRGREPITNKINTTNVRIPRGTKGRKSSRGDDPSLQDDSPDRSPSPPPPKLEPFTGDPKKGSWMSFISKLEILADHYRWSDKKKIDRLLYSLSEKALA